MFVFLVTYFFISWCWTTFGNEVLLRCWCWGLSAKYWFYIEHFPLQQYLELLKAIV